MLADVDSIIEMLCEKGEVSGPCWKNVQMRQRVAGKGELKEQKGFLVSQSLILPSVPLRAGGDMFSFPHSPPKKKEP